MAEHDTWYEGDEPDPSAPPPERYEVRRELGRGAMGVVAEVYDQRLERVVARKSLQAGADATGFRREARMAAALEHPGIVPIYEASDGPDGPWYTMRRIDGRSLEQALTDCRTLEERLALVGRFLRLCEAMAYAHRQHVVHRDLKPANVMLGPFGEVVVVDFGLAASVDASHAGRVAGTPAYMSPEAARGAPPTPQTDVWSLGAILYEILGGRAPWNAPALEIVQRVRTEDPQPVTDLVQDAPAELIAIVTKAMDRDLDSRYPDAGALRADVAAFTTGRLVGAYTYSNAELFRRFVHQYRGYLTLGALSCSLLLLVGIGATWQIEQGRQRALAAEAERTRQLALALEARARSLGGSPEARSVAAEALRHDPTLPWARGVLAEHNQRLKVRRELLLERTDCTWGARVEDHMLLHCDEELLLLDAATGRQRAGVPFAHRAPRLSPQGIVMSSSMGTVHLAALGTTDLELRHLPIRLGDLNQRTGILTWGARGQTLYLSDHRGEVTLMEPAADGFAPTRTLALGPISAVESSGRHHLLFHTDNTVLCDLDFLECRTIAFSGSIQYVTWLSDERAALLATSGELYLMNAGDLELRLIERLPPGTGADLVALDAHTVAVLGTDGTVRLYDEAGSQTVATESRARKPRSLVAFGSELWVIGTEGVERWSVEQPESFAVRRLPDGVGALTYHRGQLVASYRDRVITFDGPSMSATEIVVAKSFVKDLESGPAGLSIAQARGPILLVDGGTPAERPPSGVSRLASTDGHVIATTFDFHLWVDGVETPWHSRGDLGAGGGRVSIQTSGDTVTILQLPAMTKIWEQALGGEIWSHAIAPDGSKAAIALDDYSVTLVDLRSGVVRKLDGLHTGPVAKLAFSPSGARLASASWDGTSLIWRNGELEAALEAHRGRVTQVLFVDDEQLYTGSWDQTVRRWDLSAWQ